MKRIISAFAVLLLIFTVCVGCSADEDNNAILEDVKMNSISAATKRFVDYLGCSCSYVGPADDMKAITKAYYTALEKGKAEGFTPVIIGVDRVLTEAVAAAVSDGDEISFELGSAYRDSLLQAETPDAAGIFARREQEFSYLFDIFFEEEATGPADVEKEETVFGNGMDSEVIIANIPTDEPWKVFAWVPFGGFNDCPSNEELMAVSEYWYRLYGAYPAYISYDRLEYHVEKPVSEDKVMALCEEHMKVCPTIAEFVTPSEYAGTINGDDMWSFWWD